ncbi:MAG: bifunctional glutamate N-acetyltransferase/amino-acid acetyltransferase ArgJ [Litoreibacter sp.]
MASITKISPLAPKEGFPALPAIEGVRFSTVEAGVKYKNRPDVMLAAISPGAAIAGVFTTSATRAAPVLDCQEKLGKISDPDKGFAILVNSGNANAFTGKNGTDAVASVTQATAAALNIPDMHVYTSSTGVIGEALPSDKITAKISDLAANLSADYIADAANAIMTTDTFPKGATIQTNGITIAGIAKGSGMIAPDMATMLVYIFTDAKISQPALQRLISKHNAKTFNCITVDSDTSTSDTLLVAATGKSGEEINEGTPEFDAFSQALHDVMRQLAHQVVRDGEGATKFVEIAVTGAADDTDAHKVAMSIANSPLVKTAIAGEDPNWGRIVMAVGKSGAQADRDLLSISFGDIKVAENGWVNTDYEEEAGAAYMRSEDLILRTDLGLGQGNATVWTCDLTHQYITINADYRS